MLTYSELLSLSHLLRDQRVLSVYLDGASEDPASRTAWRAELDNALRDLRRRLEGASHDERMGFERCVELLDTQLARFQGAVGSPGWVAFITADGVRNAEPLPAPTPTLAVWTAGIYLTPYMRALKQTLPVAVVVADARKARVYRYATGVLSRAETVHAHVVTEPPTHMGDAPRPGFHGGTRGSTGRDAAQRALEAGTDRLVAEIVHRAREMAGPDGWILVGGIPEVGARIVGALERTSPHRASQVESLDIHATEAQVTAAARRGASQLRDEMDLRHVLEIVDAAEDNGMVARGPLATRQALEQARVRELYFTPRYVREHLADAEEAVRAAAAQGAAVEEVSREVAQRLDALGGMGARLRYALSPIERAAAPAPATVTGA